MRVWPTLGTRTFVAACTMITGVALSANAQEPDVATIVSRSKQAIEGTHAVAGQLSFTVSADKEKTTVTLGLALTKHGNNNRLLIVGLEPVDVRGTAYLIEDGAPDTAPQWIYLPFIRRVRKVIAAEAYSPFLNSDFTYSDLGFVDTQAAYTLLGTEKVNGNTAYRIQAAPKHQWYYTKVVTLVDGTNYLPIEREYYDRNGQLWKKERWDHITVIDGVPVPAAVTMEDVQAKTTTSVSLERIRFDPPIPDSLMTPEGMRGAADSPLWKSLGEKRSATAPKGGE